MEDCNIRVEDNIRAEEGFEKVVELVPLNVNVSDSIIHLDEIKTWKHMVIPVQLMSSVDIDAQVSVTADELIEIESRATNNIDKRRELVAKYYFVMRKSMREIAKAFGVVVSQVHNDVNVIRRSILRNLKRDLRTNKKLLEHMIDLMLQIDQQTRMTWDKYMQLEDDVRNIQDIIRTVRDRFKRGVDVPTSVLISLPETAKSLFQIHSTQQNYLNLLRTQTASMLQIWEKFGLTGDDAIKIIMTGGVDIDVKVKEVKSMVVKLIRIVKSEVKDQDSRKKVFARLVNEISFDGFNSLEDLDGADN